MVSHMDNVCRITLLISLETLEKRVSLDADSSRCRGFHLMLRSNASSYRAGGMESQESEHLMAGCIRIPSYHGTPKVEEAEIVAGRRRISDCPAFTWAVEAVNPLGQPNLESSRTSDSLQGPIFTFPSPLWYAPRPHASVIAL